ncbi:polysaccharide biosynthesis tyrosine autokinase [Psychrobacillus sp. NEAU-3TGS]|uniref:polysaccharide biosynthesis tyrosine autokinase n=1 Tax=Psychrobacillus sp. NEAU-3TGS TaxID=2995412 RepID=UPI00249C1D28|nr:polysaccharide biosynthesis tyrosine autokinase [Psychrobacillus sp. NEAU-3TGS]
MKEILRLFYKKRRVIIIVVLLITLGGGSIYFTIPPVYEVRTDLLINNSNKISPNTLLQANEIDTNLRLIETYKQMLKSDRMISKVNEELEKPYSKGTITNNVIIETSNNSQIITIVVSEKTPEAAALLANIYAETFQKQVNELMNLENINILKEVSAETDVTMVKLSAILYYFISFVIGILLCIITILIREFYMTDLNTVIKTERSLGIPSLGTISITKTKKSMKKRIKDKQNQFLQNLNNRPHLIEEFRNLRANVQYQMEQKKIKAFMVTSANVGDGKTFVSGNLAIVMAMDGKKTVYVDTDLRKPDGRKLFNLPERKGLTSAVSGEFKLEEIIQQTSINNLFFISAGPTPTNTAEVLSSTRMKEVVEELKTSYDVIIFDTSPLSVTDALGLSSLVDGCLFVVNAVNTKEELARKSMSRLTKVGRIFLGSVLNRSDIKQK